MNLFKNFSWHNLRKIFWPIESNEYKFFIPMATILMFSLYNFAALRSIKDSLIVPQIGAESISFLKLWIVLPSAILFTLVYIKLSNALPFHVVFYCITSFFIIFFYCFAFFIYPNRELIHPDPNLIKVLILDYPNFKWFIKIYSEWSFALMYAFAELWSVVVINLMFWQFANHTVETKDAKRFYPLFGVIGNLGLILAGNSLVYFSNVIGIPDYLKEVSGCGNYSDDDVTLRLSIIAVIFSGIILQLLMVYMQKVVLKDVKLTIKRNAIKATKLSVKESVKLILNSKYIGYITIIIICYGLSINIVEGPWKSKIQSLYPTRSEYLSFMGELNRWMGLICIIFMVLGSNIIRIFPWGVSAIVPPLVIGVSGLMFYVFVVFGKDISQYSEIIGNPIFAAVIAGSIQNILSKASKYSLFDSTKEMAYIPLDNELRTKGKAAAEVIGAKFGKSLGAVIQSTIFILATGLNFDDITFVLMLVFVVVISVWLYNVVKLSKEYYKYTENK